jgi:RNA polymerase sigma-70 factor (ECF subfamily)
MDNRYGALPSSLQAVTSINEASLLATARSGEAAALDTLCRAPAEQSFRIVHRVARSREDSDDAVQDCLLRAFLHRKSFDGSSTFSIRRTRIGINSVLMILRKTRHSRDISTPGASVDETLWEVQDSAPHPEIRCAKREREGFLQDASAGLRPRLRRTLEFHTLQDHSLRDTAAQLDISVTAAKTRSFAPKRPSVNRKRCARSTPPVFITRALSGIVRAAAVVFSRSTWCEQGGYQRRSSPIRIASETER